MPELPEVSVVCDNLDNYLKDEVIDNVVVKYLPILENDIVKNIVGKKINKVYRYGKYIVFDLFDGIFTTHLRMEGKFLTNIIDNNHIHIIFYFKSNKILYYKDTRKFGRMKYYSCFQDFLIDKNLGKEAICGTDIFDYFKEKIKKKKENVKKILLDQSIICGLGNIYVDEVLYSSNILPYKKVSLLTNNNILDILTSSNVILNKAILNKGTTIRSYTSDLGISGNYQNYLSVHTKTHCPKGHLVFVDKINSRSSYFCIHCQNTKRYIILLKGNNFIKQDFINYLEENNFYIIKNKKDINYILDNKYNNIVFSLIDLSLNDDLYIFDFLNEGIVINKLLITINKRKKIKDIVNESLCYFLKEVLK